MNTFKGTSLNFTPTTNTGDTSTTSTTGLADITQKKGLWNTLWDGAKGLNVDKTDISNLAMYASTVSANKRIGNLQRQAIAESLYTQPYMPHNYLRIDRRNSAEATEAANRMTQTAGRVAKTTSDMNAAQATQLEGQNRVEGIISKGQQLDLDRFDKLRGMQMQSDASINEYNTKVLGKNRGMTAEAASKIPLITTNQINADNTDFTNIVRATNTNDKTKDYKRLRNEYNVMSQDPN
ncbi:MAG: hypothetical protein ACOH2V_01240 [Candidatus Saccharimonadaceae bacterium]